MKMKHIAGMFTLALAAFAAPLTTFAVADGDIYEIVSVKGSCTPETALTSGDDFEFVVRLMARDDTDRRQWGFAYNTSSPTPVELASVLYPPSIGVVVGGRLVSAVLCDEVVSPTKMYTDLHFRYTVRPGDIALPAKLALEDSTTDNPKYADSDFGLSSTTPYCLLQSIHWSLEDELGNKAKLLWGEDLARTEQTRLEVGTSSVRSYDYTLELANFHVRSILLGEKADEDQEGDDLWQVNEGSTKPFPVTTVGVPENAVTLYAWADEEDAVKVKGAATSVTLPDSSVVTRQMYTFKVTTGVTEYTIPVTGVASNKSGKVVLSPKPGYTYDAAGALVTNFITRTVKCIEALPPSISATFDGDKVVASVTASTNDTQDIYITDAVPVTISLTEPFGVATNVTLSLTLVDSPAADVFASNYVGVAVNNTAFSKPPVVTNVFFAADSTEATVYVYPMGGDSMTYSGGIHIEPVLPSGTPFDKYTPAGCTLRIKDATPAVVSPTASSAPFAGTVKGGCDIDIEIRDCYRDQNTPQTFNLEFNFSDGSTFKTNGIAFARGVAKTVNVKGFGSSATWAIIKVTDSQGNSSVSEQVPIIVEPVKTVSAELVKAGSDTAEAETELVFPEGASRWVRFKVNQPSGADMYAFLVPLNEASSNLVSTAHIETGTPIAAGTLSKVLPNIQMSFLDGCASTGDLQFDVQLRTGSSTNDALITTYDSQKLYISVTNVPPYLKAAQFNGSPVSNGGTVTAYSGTDVKLKATAADVSLVDLRATNDNERVVMRWMYSDGPVGEESWTTVFTTNAENEVSAEITAVFNAEGTTQTVEVRAADKDMLAAALNDLDAVDWDAAPAYRYSVKVNPPPSVTVLDDGGNDMASYFPTYTEMNNGSSSPYVTVKLSPAPNGVTAADPLTVQLVLTKNGDGNAKLSTTNLATFTAGKATSARVYLYDLDGAYDSSFTISAAVVTTNKTSSGTRWCDYYAKGEGTFRVLNVSPEITGIAGVNTSVTNKTTLGATVSMSATVKDISADLAATNKFSVTWYDAGGAPNKSKSLSYTVGGVGITNNVVAAWDFSPSVEGYFSIRVSADDGDGSDPDEKEIWFYVEPSKQLQVSPYHPVATTDTRYKKAMGAGTGRIWANGVRVTASDWVHTWYYNVKTAVANVYAWGYPGATNATGYADNGKLGQLYGTVYRDVALTAAGATSETPLLDSECYTYASPYDNFFYTWAYVTPSETGGSPAIEYGNPKPTLSPSATVSGTITLDEYQNDKESYAVRMMEAIFSREYRLVDNLGDINADGVPDLFAVKYAFDAYDAEGAIVGNDLESLADYNADGDFYGATTNSEQKFTAPMEIRGLHDGLNYGMFPVTDEDGWVSDLDMSLAEKKALIRWAQADTADPLAAAMLATCTDPADDAVVEAWLSDPVDADYATQQAAAKSYISSTWSGYVEGDVTTWGFTVENRTSPVNADTDGDEMPDGWEYYWWYAATVGSKADGTGLMVGKRFNLSDIENPTDIPSDEIARTYNPNVKRNWTEQDTDNDGLLDVEERAIGTNPLNWDSDGDGLPDVYEVMWSIDPLKNENGVNGAMNADGDFMAVGETDEYFTIYDIEGALYAVRRAVRLLVDDVEQPIPYMFVPGSTNEWTVVGLKVGEFDGGYIPLDHEVSSNIAHRLTVTTTNVITMVGINSVNLYHYQVYGYFGFDPRTGWFKHKSNDGLSNTGRWLSSGSVIGGARAVNTEPFTAINEFKLLKFRYMLGLRDLKKDLDDLAAVPAKTTIAKILAGGCTNPNAVKDNWSWPFGDKSVEYPTTHGADTDKDGVPDGWELYVGVNPNIPFTDTTNESLYNAIRADDRADGLALDVEYAGTDSCGVYEECESIFANHPSQEASANHLWFNKFFPTDPRSDDTDADGIHDGEERATWTRAYTFNRWGQTKPVARNAKHFSIYGTPQDLGSSRCIPGAGFNPCTIDTDSDALPDLWERQYAGILINGSGVADAEPYIVFKAGVPDSELYDDIRAALAAYGTPSNKEDNSGWYVIGGQDGTVSDAATKLSLGANDLDWDADGLQNWQEYIIQAVRHFRYDDCKTPLMGFDIPAYNEATGKIEPGAWNGTNGYLRASYSEPFTEVELNTISNDLNYVNFAAWAKENPDYLGLLGYFADPPKKWDVAHLHLGWKYMMPPNLVHDEVFSGMEQLSWEDEGGTNHTLWVVAGDTSGLVITNGWPNYVHMQLVDGAEKTYETMIAVDSSIWGLGVGTIDVALEPLEEMVTRNRAKIESAYSYVGTDPRLWDTDADGMDDYWEMFHGLNPILGATSRPATEGVTNENTTVYYKDIIAEAYILSDVSANKNGWTGWDNESAPPYDPIRYPWMMGTGDCDADGDGFRNDEEGLYANTTSPGQLHTDPTPFWMTDFDAGVTNLPSINLVTVVVTNSLTGDPVYDFVGGVLQPRTVSFAETNSVLTLFKKPSYTALYYQNEFYDHLTLWQAWRDVTQCETLFSFEENEGYDTDNDWRSDSAERKNGVEPTSDPLDFSDPSRRQSLWLGGRGVAVSPTPAKRYSEGVDLYRQFTVEAWARPENPVAGEDQYVASRAVNYTGWDATHTNTVIRMNFAIGFDKDGHAFAEYENTTRSSCRIIADEAVDASATNWVHLAATYDGSMLCLYVNGDLKKDIETTMPPATGVLEPQQDPQAISHFPYVAYYAMPSATIVGGKVCGPGAFDVDAAAKTGIDGVATNFFKGSVGEVRMWDGARSAAELKANYRKAFTTDEIKEMRSSTALKFMSGMRRNDNSGETSLPCELVQHYNFQTLAGATETNYVQKVPAGFAKNMLANVMSPADGSVLTNAVEILWWKDVVESADLGSVYDSRFVVPWIENTIAHLPMICGAMKDSFYWSENFAGFTPASFHGLSKFAIPNSMNPYNAVKITSADDFRQEQRYRNYVDEVKEDENDESDEVKTSVWYRYRYDIRIAFTATTDLLPLGDAYAKRLTDNWDGIGVDDAWASTTDGTKDDDDPDEDGIPGWAFDMGYTTAKAYRTALEDGLLPTGVDPDYRTYVGDADTNGNNIPDWWENHFGIMGCDPNEDLDNDGLSNYQEYFISFGNWSITTTQPMSLGSEVPRNVGMPFLDPTNPHSGTNGEAVVDYFLKPDSNWTLDPRLAKCAYFGQMVTDHDFMESWWEHKNDISYSNAFVYDPQFDGDGDGWSNFSEARAYSWHGGYIASIIDRYFSANEEYHDVAYPVPAIGVRPTYFGMQNISGKRLVVRTMTSADKRVDATFAVNGSTRSGDAADTGSHFVGSYIGDASLHGFLHPGRIMPSSDIIIYRRPVNDSSVYVWHLNPEKYTAAGLRVGTYVDYHADVLKYGETDVILDAVRPAEYEFARAYSDTEGRMGEFVVSSTNAFGATEVKIGKIDYLTGEYSFNPDLARQIGVDPSECVYRIAYSYVIGDEWPQTLWLSDTSTAKASGRVKEGKNTIEAFIDINANGAWDLGEPYGAVKDVDIGWHKTPEALTIELKDNPSIPARMALALGGANEGANAGGDGSSGSVASTASVLVRRVAINGTSENMPVRTLVTRSVASDDRAYLTEADLVSAARPDLDWAWLVGDAETMGIASIDSVTYSVETHDTLPDGTVTNNVLGIFTRSFGAIRRKPTALAPAYEAPVYAARPTFTFVSGDDTMTAYCMQISTNDTADGVIWESGARLLPGRAPYTVGVDAAYSVSPDFFVDTFATTNGSAFVASGTNYYWRVAVMNAKFKDLADDAWSDWMAFQMDVGNGNRKPDTQTGCGDAAVAVRYYGAGDVTGTNGVTNVVVEAYASADFTGVPLARVRLADISGITNATDVATTNAVLRGLPSGDAYLLAYIDSNNDGKRQAYESWGYANRVGEDTKFIYTPVPVAIEDTMGKYPSVTIFIEDTDVNQNEMPDVLELDSAAWSTGEGVDADGDGLTDELEGDYGTDANLWDTDGDGMPDGWEALFANTDPTLADAGDAVDGDVMAYAEVTRTVVTFDGDSTTLFVVDGAAVPQVGDEATNYTYLTTYDYGSALGVGTNFTASATDRIASVETRSVALVHAQVYSEYGFNPATANPTTAESERVNTKEFTALDKYLVARYLEAYGVTNVNEVAMNTNGTWASYTLRPGTADTNGDGVADGWELYVMFGTNTTVSSVDDMKVSPFGTAAYVRDSANTPDAGSLSILDEFDRGNTPTDPWQKDTDGDGIEDKDAFRFKIKTAESQLGDDDNDGLSNWAEYLAWKLTGLDFDVADPCSVADNRLDYYFVVTNGAQKGKYVGECVDADGKGLIADHDFVEDRLETQYSELAPDGKLYANRYVWDALRDADGDGWSNWSEVRSGTRPTSVSGLDVDGNTDADYPQPVVALTVSYNGSDRFNAPIMVQAWSEEYAAGQPDAAWQIGEGSGEEGEESASSSESTELAGTENTRYLGFNTGDVRTFYIGPGKVIPGSVSVKFKDPEWMLYHYTYGPDGTPMFYGGEVHSLRDATWQGNVRDKADKNDPSMGKIYFSGTVTDDPADSNVVERVVGSVNYSTGEVTLDFSVLNNTIYFSGSISSELTLNSGNVVSIVNMSESYVQIAWRSGKTEIGTHSTYFLGKPNATEKVPSLGHLREGETTFIVFSDSDGNGVYTEGEPLGVVKHVKVGWDKVSDLVVELSETSRSADRFVVDAITNGVATTRIKVMRTAINGRDVSPRVVYSRTIDFTSARLFTEADFIADGEWDFDWKRLCTNAVELAGVSTNDISSVGYAVYLGSSTEPVRTFTRTFAATNVPPVATSTYAGSDYLVRTARPTLQWSGAENGTAFALQIAEDNAFTNVVYATTNFMPAATEGGYAFKPEAYVGAELEDGSNYFWRVSSLNSKFREPTWSKPAKFEMAVASDNADTGYGRLGLEVRYFGPASNELSEVVVGVYESADFAGAPVARVRMSGTGTVASLTNDLSNAFSEAVTNVVLDGIAPGRYFAMAFVDSNTNGVRDAWETWGYVNKVATESADLWTPVATEVVSTKAALPTAFLVMEDTDANQNAVPDCLDDASTWDSFSVVEDESADSDGDGLTDFEENYKYGTDPALADTDGDGVPDGYEVKVGTDPLNADADFAGLGDYMAYAEVEAYVFSTNGVSYILNVDRRIAYKTFSLGGTNDMLVATKGATNVDFTAYNVATNALSLRKVALVHSAVYDWFGFDSSTALAPDATNTVPFTAYWKYLTSTNYLAAFDVALDDPLSVESLDYNANGLPDGWELYVAFANPDTDAGLAANANKTFPVTDVSVYLNAAGTNSVAAVYDPYDQYYLYNAAKSEGTLPALVAPYSNAFAISNNLANATAEEQEAFWSYAGEGDVMAYRLDTVKVMVTTNGAGAVSNRYAVNSRFEEGDAQQTNTVYTVFEVEGQLFVGAPTNLVAATNGYAYAFETNAVVMHSAVYDFYGYDPTTAKPAQGEGTNAVAGVNTVPFTRLMKQITQEHYLAEVDAANAAKFDLMTGKLDSNANYVPDGYELYVRYAAGETYDPAASRASYGDNAVQTPFDPYDEYYLYDAAKADGTLPETVTAFMDKVDNTTFLADIDTLTNDWTKAQGAMAIAEGLRAVVATTAAGDTNYVVTISEDGTVTNLIETARLYDDAGTLVAYGKSGKSLSAIGAYTLAEEDVTFVHNGVYSYFGFDPTTARMDAGTNAANTAAYTYGWQYFTTNTLHVAPTVPGELDANTNGVPDGWELYVGVADALAYRYAYDPYDQYYFWTKLLEDDPATYGALAPFTNAEAIARGWLAEDWNWSAAQPGDYMAYAEVMAQLVMSNDVVYAVHVATNEFGAVTATNLYETFTLENGMVVVGKVDTNATVTAGLFSATVSTNVVLVHSAVYDWFGFNPTTALAPSGEGTNAVVGVNTAPFTAAWKEVTEKLYLNRLFGIGWTFDAGVVDSNANGLPDGWELYVAFAHDADNANEAAPAFPLAGASLATAVSNFDEGDDVSDPWNERYFWELLGDETVAVYNNDEARMFNLTDGDLLKDEDFDGLSNYKEFLAASVYSVTTDVHNAMSDGLTNDYFRATGGSYLGLELNGGEFIESDARAELGMQALRLAGTVARGDGWDYWSAARNAYANAGTNGVDFSATPVPEVRLRLSNAESGTRALTVSAYQVKEDIGYVFQAQWAVSADFAGGVADVVLGKPDTGALKQGQAFFVVVDEALGARGRVEAVVGLAGVDLEVRLTEPNGFLQEVKVDGDITNGVQVVGVVRTKVNGKDVKPRGVALYKYWNNVAREFDHPGEYDVWGGSFVGLDRFLAEDFAADLESVESVTYEIVNLAAEDVTDLDAAVSAISVSNLNAYASADAEGEGTLRNREITYAYSLRRDIPNVYVSPSGMVDDPMVVFEYDSTSVYTSTRYWVEVSNATTGVVYPTTPSDGGILLERPIDGVVKVDLLSIPGLTLASNTVYSVRVALGNDKFGKPETAADWSLPASLKVGAEPAFGGSITVTVNHPTVAAPSGSLKIAVYDKADLATPVKVVDGTVGAPQAVSGLRVGGDYYVAAWLVKDANDGRADPDVRQPYDTWGYATELGVDATCFDAFAVRASATPGAATATVYLQDTDWNDNGIVDREEEFLAVDAIVTRTLTAGDLELEGFPEEGVPSDTEDVMAYAKVARTLVLVGTNAATAAWYTLPAGYDVSVGVAATNLPAGVARTTYVYAGKTHGPYGEGAAKTFAATDGSVLAVEDGEVVLVHAQVYEEFGFNWATANRTLDASERVNSKIFTPMDKAYVVAYLRAIGVTVAPADEAAWSLNRSKTDFDYDGMPDGWELYVMFGPSGAASTPRVLPPISPLVYDDRANDPDNDGLENVGEYDGGFMPTDPWDKDTDDDGVEDKASRDYLFKYGGTGDGLTGYRGDADNDQLSNLIEYMIQGLTNFPDVVASKMSTFDDTEGQLVPDYFLPHGLLYLGEMFTDHDMIEDWWEDEQPAETMVGAERAANYSRYSYDAAADSDGDGWSNWVEARLAIAGGKVTVTEFETNVVDGVTVVTSNEVEKAAYEASGRPTPTVEAALRYNGDKTSLNSDDKLVVMAWGPSRPTVAECDAAWVMPVGDLANGLMQVSLAEPEFGALREGENTFVAYVASGTTEAGSSEESASAIPQFEVGQPYGVATGVRVSYLRGTPFTLELTHVDSTMARVNLPAALGIQRTFADTLAKKDEEWWASWLLNGSDQWYEYYKTMHQAYLSMKDSCSDRGEGKWEWATVQRSIDYAGTNMTFAASNSVHVWVVQVLMNGEKASNGAYYRQLMSLGNIDLERHPILTEADVLTAVEKTGTFDLGWGTVTNDFVAGGHPDGYDLASASFAIILETPPAPSYHIDNNLLALEVVNHYDLGLSQDDTTNKTVVTVGSQPTFCWQHVSIIGKPYPAFQLKVWKKSDSTLVYDSGAQRAPARDENGVYRWTAPLWAGSITPQGVVFEADEDYVWDVSMLDAKFTTFNGSVTKGAALRVSDTSGDSLISDYGSIAVAVKYMGPGAVNTNGTLGVVRVEAYDSPDFSGMPVAAGYVMNKNTIAATDKIALNAIVKGLPKGGEYYVLAYLDSNGDGVRQAWESWGYGCYVGDPDRRDVYTPRAYGVATDAAGDLKTPTCVVYLEDADTNGNKLPDSLEVDLATGEFTGTNVTAVSSPYIVTVETNGLIAATNIFAAIEKDIVALPYYSTLVEMKNGDSLASASLALAMSGVNLAALSVEPRVTITGFDPSVGISIEIDPGVTVDHDTLVASAVTLKVDLEVEVEWTPNLATAWTLVGTYKAVDLPISGVTRIDASDTTSTAGKELYNKINYYITTTGGSSAFFRIKSVKAVHKQ